MRKWVLGAAALLAMELWSLWPFPRWDTGELMVVETLAIQVRNRELWLFADGYTGCGATGAQAVERLQTAVPGQLFLRQVRRIIFCGGAEESWNPLELPEELSVGANVYRWPGEAEDLGDISRLNRVLVARERREPQMENLAGLQNGKILGKPVELPQIEQEEVHGTEKGSLWRGGGLGSHDDGGSLLPGGADRLDFRDGADAFASAALCRRV